jgi:hypothetical protein
MKKNYNITSNSETQSPSVNFGINFTYERFNPPRSD